MRSRFGPCLAPDVAGCRNGRAWRCGADSCRLRLGPRGRRLARRVQGPTCGAQLVRISLFREAPAAYQRGPRCRRRRRGPHGPSAAKEPGTGPGEAGGTRECRVASRQGILRCPRRLSNGWASTVATVRQGLSPVALQLLMMRFPGRGALPIRPVPSRSPAQAGASLDGMLTSAENPKE